MYCRSYDLHIFLLATASLVRSDIPSSQVFHHFLSYRAQKAPIPPRELFFCLSTESFIISYLVRHLGKYTPPGDVGMCLTIVCVCVCVMGDENWVGGLMRAKQKINEIYAFYPLSK